MKKLPLYYNKQVVGYFDEIIYSDDRIIEFAKIVLFHTDLYDFIIKNIKSSTYSSFDKYIDTKNINNNNLYNYHLIDDYIICELINKN